MLSEKVLKYLKKNADETLPAYQKKYEDNFKNLGFDKDVNSFLSQKVLLQLLASPVVAIIEVISLNLPPN